MHITCPRCGFVGEAAFEFKTSQMLARLKERLSRGLGAAGSSADADITTTAEGTVQDAEIGEYTVCPRCIGVFAVTIEMVAACSEVQWSDNQTLSMPVPRREYRLTLLTAERLRRFSGEAQERLRSRMETFFKAHKNSSMRDDAVEYLQQYIAEYLRQIPSRRMCLSELTLEFVAISPEHPFHEALDNLKNRGRVHAWNEPCSASTGVGEDENMNLMVMLV